MHAAVETVHENRERQDYLRPGIGAGSTSSGHLLDLHHVHVKESLVLLELELKRWYAGATLNGGRPRSKMTYVNIGFWRVILYVLYQSPHYLPSVITGKGNNSTHGTSRLMPAVTAYLQQNGWTFEQGDGFVVVKNRSDRQE